MTSSAPAGALTPAPLRPERSRLLPFNRRLRHLHGVTVRNLTLSGNLARRRRGYTLDDEALPNTTRSPNKLLALREEQHITKTRSTGNLREQPATAEPDDNDDAGTSIGTATTPKRPARPRPRRQSTLDISSPSQRKRKEEDAIREHLAHVFFTIHLSSASEPAYISEVAPNTMNPDFRFFDLNVCPPSVARSAYAVLKVWARPALDSAWQHLQDVHLDLKYLTLVARSADQLQDCFPENALLLHFSDGIYTLPESTDSANAPPQAPAAPLPVASALAGPSEPTSSYDALMRLQTLDSCISDALESRDKLIAEINGLVTSAETSARFAYPTDVAIASDTVANTRRSLEAAARANKAAKASIANARASLASRKQAMRDGRQSSERARLHLGSAGESLQACVTTHQETMSDITGQRRRIVSELQEIFPIEPLPSTGDGTVFAIRGAALPPNSDFSNLSPYARPAEAEVSAALGHAAHLVRLLSLYLSIPLPYPLVPRSSLSAIQDPISVMPAHQSRTFPLYLGKHVGAAGALLYRFEYGVFLLNKNIEVLMVRSGTRAMDIRQTLANLGLLMFALSGGGQPGEIPARFRGAVKGLAVRHVHKRPSWHRSTSRDDASDVSSEFEATLASRRGSAAGGDQRPWARNGTAVAQLLSAQEPG